MASGTKEGVVTGAKWTDYEPDNGPRVPVLSLEVECKAGDGSVKTLRPGIFFSPELVTNGKDAGKSQIEVGRDLLASYGLTVAEDQSKDDPTLWPTEFIGVEVQVWVKVDDETGAIKCYLNRRGKPALEPEEVRGLWAAVTGAGKSEAPAGDSGAIEKDDLPW